MKDTAKIHRSNRVSLARELSAMSRLEEPYQGLINAPPLAAGIWHLAAWYLENTENGDRDSLISAFPSTP